MMNIPFTTINLTHFSWEQFIVGGGIEHQGELKSVMIKRSNYIQCYSHMSITIIQNCIKCYRDCVPHLIPKYK